MNLRYICDENMKKTQQEYSSYINIAGQYFVVVYANLKKRVETGVESIRTKNLLFFFLWCFKNIFLVIMKEQPEKDEKFLGNIQIL